MNFVKKGSGKKNLIFLHGWTKSLESWQGVMDLLDENKYAMYAVDLPGFGKSELRRAYDLADYVTDLREFLKRKKIGKPILVGHSFGGRVAIKMAAQHPEMVERLILVDSSGIRDKSLKLWLAKYLTNITPQNIKDFLRPVFGSKDYLESHGLRRETLKKIVEEDLKISLAKISVPTLIIWGKNDHTTPLWQGKLMHKLIPNSKLVVVPEADHGLPYRRPKEVAREIAKWLKS